MLCTLFASDLRVNGLYRISDNVDEHELWGRLTSRRTTASLASLQHLAAHTALRDEQRSHLSRV